jgi:REP element-mobilizing transposase RayT
MARFLCRFFRSIARDERAQLLEIGVVADHTHLLVRLHPETRLPRLVQRLKGSSAAVWGKEHRDRAGRELRWNKGYSVESVSPRSLAAVRTYLRRQADHHPTVAIPGWPGDRAEHDRTGLDEWRGPERRTR